MKIGGTANFSVNGRRYSLRANMNVALSDEERESVAGLDTIHGYLSRKVPAFIEADITDTADFDIKDLTEVDNATVIAELDNGRIGVLRNCWQITQITLDVAEAQMSLRFEGSAGEWI